MNGNILRLYYACKPFIPRNLQISLRRTVVLLKRRACADIWPIAANPRMAPDQWAGWPENKQFALVLTHDIDTRKGHDKCLRLMDMELKAGFRSSFNFVAEGYPVSADVRRNLTDTGFEVGVHGLLHSRKMYESKAEFSRHALRINRYLREWQSVGFRSPCMFHNLDWIHELNIEYDASTFDTDPFEPQSDGVGTIFPFVVSCGAGQNEYVELPYTLPQDFTLFVLMGERGIDIWKTKLDWICEKGGMALLNAHPDYMSFDGGKPGCEEYPAEFYADFLAYVKTRYEGRFWHVLPREMAQFWSSSFRRGPT